MIATITSSKIVLTRQFISKVLPVPISPVRRTNPLFSRIPYSKPASASACFSPSHRKFGSGLMLNGLVFKS